MPASDCLAHFGGDGGRRRLDESPAPTTAPLYVFEVRQPTDDVGIETTNRPRPTQGRAGRPAGSTRRTGLNGLMAIILCLLPFANGL